MRQRSKRILLLPGIGDVHWVFLKLRAFLEVLGSDWNMPEIHIWDIDRRPRTMEYVAMVPWVQAGEYFKLDLRVANDYQRETFNSLYLRPGSRDYVLGFEGYDLLVGMNGNMRHGVPFHKLLAEARVDFDYGPRPPQNGYGESWAKKYPYFVLCFSDFGMFGNAWCTRMTASKIQGMITSLKVFFPEHRFLFTGCAWDEAFTQECMMRTDTSLVGKTTLSEFLSLLRHSSGYVGWCGGNSIVAQHLGVPTAVWWSRTYFPLHDRRGWETPHAGESRQLVLEVEDFDRDKTPREVSRFLAKMQEVSL